MEETSENRMGIRAGAAKVIWARQKQEINDMKAK